MLVSRMKIFAGLMLIGLPIGATAQTDISVPAKLTCSAHSANPKNLRAFQAFLTFKFSGSTLQADRKLRAGGQERFTGTVGPTGAILLRGEGENTTGGAWVYEFEGQRNEVRDTVLVGMLTNTIGAVGVRRCSIRFLKPRPL